MDLLMTRPMIMIWIFCEFSRYERYSRIALDRKFPKSDLYDILKKLDSISSIRRICSAKVFRMAYFRSELLFVHLLPDEVSGEHYFRVFFTGEVN